MSRPTPPRTTRTARLALPVLIAGTVVLGACGSGSAGIAKPTITRPDQTTSGVPSTAPPTEAPTTAAPTTEGPTFPSGGSTTSGPTVPQIPTTSSDATTTEPPTTEAPTTAAPTTAAPTTEAPTTEAPTTAAPTTASPTTAAGDASATSDDASTTWWPLVLAGLALVALIAVIAAMRSKKKAAAAREGRLADLLASVDRLTSHLAALDGPGLRAIAAGDAADLAAISARAGELAGAATEQVERAALTDLHRQVLGVHGLLDQIALAPQDPAPQQVEAIHQAAARLHAASQTTRATLLPPEPPAAPHT